MGQRQTHNKTHPGVSISIAVMAAAVAVTPVLLAAIAARNVDAPKRGFIIAASVLWLITVVAYRGLSRTEEHFRRKALREEIADIRNTRFEAASTFQDQLLDHEAILERIIDIGERMATEGIVDPNQALNSVRLILSHARDARDNIDDAIIETRVGIGTEKALIGLVPIREEIETVATPFANKGLNVVTAGPALHAATDPTMFRLIVRSLINGAVERNADQIDVTVARDGDNVVCTVSDDGADTSKAGMKAVSGLARSLAPTADAELSCSHVLGRNQYAVAIPFAEAPAPPSRQLEPVDVLGKRTAAEEPADEASPPARSGLTGDVVSFVDKTELGRSESVAARRDRELVR